MISHFARWLRGICRSLLTSAAPEQLAAGFTLGMLIGVMPKTNLIALSLCVALFSLRCHKGWGLAAAIVFSLASPLTDPFAHKLGATVLNFDSLQGVYAATFNAPFGPWWEFNNTVVAGSLLLGLYVAYPVYIAMRIVFTALQAALAQRADEWAEVGANVQPGASG